MMLPCLLELRGQSKLTDFRDRVLRAATESLFQSRTTRKLLRLSALDPANAAPTRSRNETVSPLRAHARDQKNACTTGTLLNSDAEVGSAARIVQTV
jgi:hypothetical protein